MSDEPTKACIRVLKFENKVKYILFYPVSKFFKYTFKFIDWVVQFINWCIDGQLFVGLDCLFWYGYRM